jgi:AcrR family transcriptional regulator
MMTEADMADTRPVRDIQREIVIDAALALIAREPFAAFTREAVCQESGIKYTTVRSYFPEADVLIRLAAARLFSNLNRNLRRCRTEPADSVHAAVSSFVAGAGSIIASSQYANLLRILVREGERHGWLLQLYEEQIAAPFEAELTQCVRAAGERYGSHVVVRSGAARAALRRLESELAIPQLLPLAAGARAEDIFTQVVQNLIAATYAWDLVAATAA